MTKAIAHTYVTIHGYRRHITVMLLAVCVALVAIYTINLYRVISHTVAIQHISSKMSSLDASINRLDTQYISISRAITPDTVATHGLSQAPVDLFISRTASLGSIALAGHEL